MLAGEPPMEKTSFKELERIRKVMDEDLEKAFEELEQLDVSRFPKKQTSEIYLLMAECYLRARKYIRSHLLKQKAVDLDASVECIVTSSDTFSKIDRVIQFGPSIV